MKKIFLFILITLISTNDIYSQTIEEYKENISKLVQLERYDNAAVIVDKFLKDFPNEPEAHIYNCKLKDLRADRADAIACMYVVSERFPKNHEVQLYTGVLCLNSSLFDTSYIFFQKALKYAVNAEEIFWPKFNIAMYFYYKGMFDTAINQLNRIIIDTPTCSACYSNLSMIYERIQDYEKGLFYMKKALMYDSTSSYLLMNTGLLLSGMNKHEEAISYFDKAIHYDPKMAYAYSNRGFSLLNLKKHNEAIIDLNKSINLDNTNSYAYKNRGLIYLDLKLFKEACKDFHASKELGYQKFYGDEVDELIEKYCK